MGERRLVCRERVVAYCTCRLDRVYSRGGLTVFPNSKLMVWNGLLLRYMVATQTLFGRHRLDAATSFRVLSLTRADVLHFRMLCAPVMVPGWIVRCAVYGVGLGRVRRLQRWWRRVLAERWRQRAVAVMMGVHGRLGAASPLLRLEPDLLRACI